MMRALLIKGMQRRLCFPTGDANQLPYLEEVHCLSVLGHSHDAITAWTLFRPARGSRHQHVRHADLHKLKHQLALRCLPPNQCLSQQTAAAGTIYVYGHDMQRQRTTAFRPVLSSRLRHMARMYELRSCRKGCESRCYEVHGPGK